MNVRFRDSKGRFSKPDGRKKLTAEVYDKGKVYIRSKPGFRNKIKWRYETEKLKKKVKPKYEKIINVKLNKNVRDDLMKAGINSKTKGFKQAIITLENISKQTGTVDTVTLTPVNLQRKIKISKGKRKGELSSSVDRIAFAIRDFLRSLGYAVTSKQRRKKGSRMETIRNIVNVRIMLK